MGNFPWNFYHAFVPVPKERKREKIAQEDEKITQENFFFSLFAFHSISHLPNDCPEKTNR